MTAQSGSPRTFPPEPWPQDIPCFDKPISPETAEALSGREGIDATPATDAADSSLLLQCHRGWPWRIRFATCSGDDGIHAARRCSWRIQTHAEFPETPLCPWRYGGGGRPLGPGAEGAPAPR